ncbi:hypothetical protein HWV62_10505 [Athelia sp. TMB]|nr:hypothetical protein HWV62_10505 [Athelia sp. TMB]
MLASANDAPNDYLVVALQTTTSSIFPPVCQFASPLPTHSNVCHAFRASPSTNLRFLKWARCLHLSPPMPPPPPPPVASSSNFPQSYPQQLQQPQQHPQPAYPPPASYPQAKSEPADFSALLALSQAGPIPTSASAPPAPAIGNIANLWQSLLKAGVVSPTGTPTGAGETAKVEETKVDAVDPLRLAAREYHKSILAQKTKLTSTSITK